MDYVSGPVILYSQDKVRMMDFLSDVFEFEVDHEHDLAQNGGLHLKLIELPEEDKTDFQSLGIKFAFKIKNAEQIKEIVNKCNFFIYRKSDTHKTHNRNEEIQNLSQNISDKESTQNNSVSIKDIDGRLWQFDVETNS